MFLYSYSGTWSIKCTLNVIVLKGCLSYRDVLSHRIDWFFNFKSAVTEKDVNTCFHIEVEVHCTGCMWFTTQLVFFRGRYKTWTRSTHLPLLNTKGIIILFCGMSVRGDLVITLHIIPIFISPSCGECETANAFWQQVIMGVMFWSPLFFFLYGRKVGRGQGGQQGCVSYTFLCCSHHGTSCLKLQLLNIQLSQNQYC